MLTGVVKRRRDLANDEGAGLRLLVRRAAEAHALPPSLAERHADLACARAVGVPAARSGSSTRLVSAVGRLVDFPHRYTSVSSGALSHCMLERLIRVQKLRSSIRREQTRDGVGVEHSFRCDRDVRGGNANEARVLE